MKRYRAAGIDRLVQLADAYLAESVDVLELVERCLLAAFEREYLWGGADPQILVFAFEEELDLLGAEAFDVEGIARDEMLQMLDRLRTADEAARAARTASTLPVFSLMSRTAWLPQMGHVVGNL